MKNILKILLVFIAAVYFSGCIDEPLTSDRQLIEGKIYSEYGEWFVSAGEFPITKTNYEGNFQIAAGKPYNLTFNSIDLSGNYSSENLKLIGITINKPKILYNYNYSYLTEFYFERCRAYVYFPQLNSTKAVCSKFISSENFFQNSGFDLLRSGAEYTVLDMVIPEGKQSISGKLYYIETTMDTVSFRILSYDKYGIKNVTLNKGWNPAINFTKEEISYDPSEYLMKVNINLPKQLNLGNIFISISSYGMYKSSDLDLNLRDYNPSEIIIPLLRGSAFQIAVKGEYANDYSSDHEIYGSFRKYFNPGEPALITLNNTLTIKAPANNSENFSTSDYFEITGNSGPAIYEYTVLKYPRQIKFITTGTKVRFNEFITRGFPFSNNTNYYWYLRKFPNYHNIDEFLCQPYTLDDRYDYIELSPVRTFKTAP